VSWGYFDVDPGVLGLHPKQQGDVTFVATENKHYEKGEELLRLNDKLAQLKVKEAEEDVKAGERQLEEAQQLPEFYKLQADEQQAAIKAVENEIEKTKLDEKIKLRGLGDNPELKKNSEEYFKFALDSLAQKKKSEAIKLQRIKLQKPNLKIDQADADLTAKKLRLEQAKEVLNHFKVTAPHAGTVLRVNTRVAETLGPNPRAHAVEFKPDGEIIVRAEVLQEWARFVKDGAEVVIEDDTYHGATWKGKVKSTSPWFAPTRSPVIEPFRYNDVRTMECIITVEPGGDTKRIGQRVRAMIKMQ
jgi:multidrug resistance efflux pump